MNTLRISSTGVAEWMSYGLCEGQWAESEGAHGREGVYRGDGSASSLQGTLVQHDVWAHHQESLLKGEVRTHRNTQTTTGEDTGRRRPPIYQGESLPSQPSQGPGPGVTLIMDFQPPFCRRSEFLLFEPICGSLPHRQSPSRLVRPPSPSTRGVLMAASECAGALCRLGRV